jgi:drug/metabolite transporter (DMT)-like permease
LIYLFVGTDFIHTIQEPNNLQGLIYPAILGVLGSALAISLFNILIKLKSVLFAASVTYMIPIVALFFGIFDGEHFPPINFLWVAAILGGVLLVNKKK